MENVFITKNIIQKSEKSYAEKWNISSDYIKDKAGYVWMAAFVEGYGKILEIGCGNGNSTLELAKRGHKIVCIEENIHCIKTTYQKLRQSNISVKTILKGNFINSEFIYKIKYDSYSEEYETDIQVYIIEGNILSFQTSEYGSLYNWLLKIAPFDGIICWLIGTHELALRNSLVIKTMPYNQEPKCYKNNIEYIVAKLKDMLVCENGFIHFVDRLENYDLNLDLNACLNANFKTVFSQERSLPISKCSIESMQIGNFAIDGGVEMGISNYDTNKLIKPHENNSYLYSVFYKF